MHKITHIQFEKIPLSWKILHWRRGQRGRLISAVCLRSVAVPSGLYLERSNCLFCTLVINEDVVVSQPTWTLSHLHILHILHFAHFTLCTFCTLHIGNPRLVMMWWWSPVSTNLAIVSFAHWASAPTLLPACLEHTSGKASQLTVHSRDLPQFGWPPGASQPCAPQLKMATIQPHSKLDGWMRKFFGCIFFPTLGNAEFEFSIG